MRINFFFHRYNLNLETGRRGSSWVYFERMHEVCGDQVCAKSHRKNNLQKQQTVTDSTELTPQSVESCVLPSAMVCLDSDNNEDVLVNNITTSLDLIDAVEDSGLLNCSN